MAEKVARLARPSSTLEEPGVLPSNGINRSQLTLYLSIAAIILSVASAGTHLFIYLNGERAKMAAETDLARTLKTKEEALARAAQLGWRDQRPASACGTGGEAWPLVFAA